MSEGPQPGQVIAGKFVIDRVIGVGGMGLVVAAHHLQLPQRVAIKFMRAQAARDPNAVERFLREARAAAALSSEHVTKVFDVGTLPSGEPYLVMELLDGLDLARALEQHGPMPVEVAVDYVLQACEAIAEAHSLGIVHRDLKPANLFLHRRRDGSTLVKVLDFGISKVADFNSTTSANLTASGLVMGSPAYMSPEQVRSAKSVDARTDIWALGVILFELVAGRAPFRGETVGELLAQILAEPPPSLRELRADAPPRLEAVLIRCLERRLERRIQNVGELAEALVSMAPAGAAGSLERVLLWRSAGVAGREVMADGGPPVRGPFASSSNSGSGTQTAAPSASLPNETGPPWLRTGSSMASGHRGSRRSVIAVFVVASVGLLLFGAYRTLRDGAPHEVPMAAAPPVGSGGGSERPAASATETPRASDPEREPPTSVELADGPVDGTPASTAGAPSRGPGIPPARKSTKPNKGHPPHTPTTAPTSDEKDLY